MGLWLFEKQIRTQGVKETEEKEMKRKRGESGVERAKETEKKY